MTRDEAVQLLKGGLAGVREFNKRREAGDPIPRLSGITLREVHLSFDENGKWETADLTHTDLVSADFTGTRLIEVNLAHAQLGDADFSNAVMQDANLRGAKLHSAKFVGADLQSADLRDAQMNRAILSDALLLETRLDGAVLTEADLRDSDLGDATGLRLDSCRIRGADFGARPSDPWSVLRRTYTGPMLLFHLLILCVFVGTYAGRAAIWIGINRGETAAALAADRAARALESLRVESPNTEPVREGFEAVTQAIQSLDPTTNPDYRALKVWQVLLGFHDQDVTGWLGAGLTCVLVAYNVLRGGLTWWVGLLRDAEERSARSPAWKDYRWASYAHRFFMRWVLYAALLSLCFHAWGWLTTDVWLPK